MSFLHWQCSERPEVMYFYRETHFLEFVFFALKVLPPVPWFPDLNISHHRIERDAVFYAHMSPIEFHLPSFWDAFSRSVIFMDEIDSLCRRRTEKESESVRNVKVRFMTPAEVITVFSCKLHCKREEYIHHGTKVFCQWRTCEQATVRPWHGYLKRFNFTTSVVVPLKSEV